MNGVHKIGAFMIFVGAVAVVVGANSNLTPDQMNATLLIGGIVAVIGLMFFIAGGRTGQ